MTAVEEKSLLRKEALRLLRRSAFPSALEVAEAVRREEAYRSAENLFAFCPMPTEPDTRLLIDLALDDGKAVWLPVCIGPGRMEYALAGGRGWRARLSRHPNGTLVPPGGAWADLEALGRTLVLAPGLLFTGGFCRLGRGGGYYDTFLARIENLEGFTALGVCLRSQIREALPLEPHDRRLDGLVILS